MKVRILTDGSSYTIQYAALDAVTYTEVTINKDFSKLKSAFSLSTGTEIDVQPGNFKLGY